MIAFGGAGTGRRLVSQETKRVDHHHHQDQLFVVHQQGPQSGCGDEHFRKEEKEQNGGRAAPPIADPESEQYTPNVPSKIEANEGVVIP